MLFEGCVFYFDKSVPKDLIARVKEEAPANSVSKILTKKVTHACFGDADRKQTNAVIINDQWLNECIQKQKIVELPKENEPEEETKAVKHELKIEPNVSAKAVVEEKIKKLEEEKFFEKEFAKDLKKIANYSK